ncbi:MAG: hypothetical protein ACREOO_30725 [bacterium]
MTVKVKYLGIARSQVKTMQTLLKDFASTLEQFGNRIQDAFSILWEGLLDGAARLTAAARNFCSRIKDWLAQLWHTLFHLGVALAKLSLFYLPGLLALLLGWVGFAIFWLAAITAIGLLYGKGKTSNPSEDGYLKHLKPVRRY